MEKPLGVIQKMKRFRITTEGSNDGVIAKGEKPLRFAMVFGRGTWVGVLCSQGWFYDLQWFLNVIFGLVFCVT